MFTDVFEINAPPIIRRCVWASVICLLAGGCLTRAPEDQTDFSFVKRDTLATESASVGQQWPGWRGASLHGVSRCTDLPTQWNRDQGIRWRVDVSGQGNSSPVVWDDHVYLTSHVNVGGEDELVAICFDRHNGEGLWQSSLGMALGPTHQKNGYASSTVAVDGNHVVAFVASRRLYCLDHSGAELWRVDFPTTRHQWGLAASPLIFRNVVIQVCDGQPQSFVVAIDLDTGREVWRTDRESQGSWSTPVICEVTAGDTKRYELIVNGTSHADGSAGYVSAYNPLTGEPLWHTACTTDTPCPTMIVGGGLVISTSGGNGPVVAIRPGGKGDISDSHVAWQHSRGGPYVPTGVAYQNRLFTISDSGRLSSYNLADGQLVWNQRLSGTFTASLVAGDGKIYATNERGEVYVIPAVDQYELVAANPLGERCLTTPAIAHSDIFIRTENSLFCIKGGDSSSAGDFAAKDQAQADTVHSLSDRDATSATKTDQTDHATRPTRPTKTHPSRKTILQRPHWPRVR